MRTFITIVFAAGLAEIPVLAAAEIYKCVDGSGRPLYTSDKRDTTGKKCQVVTREITVVPAVQAPPKTPASASGSRAATPRDDVPSRSNPRERQRQILEKELAAEEDMLQKSRKALAEQEEQRSGNERNYARVEERLKPYRDDVQVHEKNIEALRRELNNLNR